MDEDVIFLILFFGGLVLVALTPLFITVIVVACRAWHITKLWKKERLGLSNGENSDVEFEALVESDFEILDSDDEAEAESRAKEKEDKQLDLELTTYQKFRKEFRKGIKGPNLKEAAAKKERDERKKVAKAVAKEVARLERRRGKMAAKKAEDAETFDEHGESSGDTLPSYSNAVAAKADKV